MHRWGGIHRELLGVLVAFLGVVVRCWRDKRGLGEWVCGDGGLSFGFLWGEGRGEGKGGCGRFLLTYWRIGTLVMLAMVYMCCTWEYVIESVVRNMYI